MKIQEKMDRVEAETILLMAYMDSRELRADIGVSALISVLLTVTTALDIPISTLTQAMDEAHAMRNRLFSSEGKSLH
jgi:hypothetical protein